MHAGVRQGTLAACLTGAMRRSGGGLRCRACPSPRSAPAGFSRPAVPVTWACSPCRALPPPVVYSPAATLPVLRSPHELAQGAGVLDASRLAALPGLGAGRVLGPAWYGYPAASSLPAVSSLAVRPLAAADLGLPARLHAETPPAEVPESGTDGLPAFGYLDAGALLAVACLGTWRAMPAIGVCSPIRGPAAGDWRGQSWPRRPGKPLANGPSCNTAPGGPAPPRSPWPYAPDSPTSATASSSTSISSRPAA